MERGSVVKAGDVLVVLDPVNAVNDLRESELAAEELRARLGITTGTTEFDPEKQPEVESAKSTFDLASANLERDTTLRERNVISQADFDLRRNEYNAARQNYELSRKLASQLHASYRTSLVRVEKARQRLDDMTIRAPFSGVIAEKMVAPGEAVEGGGPGAKPVATLLRIDPLRLVLTVPEQHVALVKAGAEVDFTVTALPDRVFKASIAHIGARLDSASRSLTAEAIVDNSDGALRPGYFATARLFYAAKNEAFLVPTSAVLRKGDVARVYVVRDNTAREQIVTVGDDSNGRALITSGVSEGDRVVADASRVSEGAKVR
jgi:membrane fusion protein (multidrug efflux system)